MLGGWDRTDVAQAQRDRVVDELQHAQDVGPFRAFIWAMEQTGIVRGTLLDVGCGVGHYGVLCEKNCHHIVYTGTDASAAIIAEARLLAPLGKFEMCAFEHNYFEGYDIVMASQVIEMLPDCWAALELLLTKARRCIILNRIRLAPDGETSHAIEESTYCGCSGHEWLWNIAELTAFIGRFGVIVGNYDWDNQTCFVIKKDENVACAVHNCCAGDGTPACSC